MTRNNARTCTSMVKNLLIFFLLYGCKVSARAMLYTTGYPSNIMLLYNILSAGPVAHAGPVGIIGLSHNISTGYFMYQKF